MPRFYFDSRDGDTLIRDEDGLDLKGAEEARAEAALALAEMARDIVSNAEHRHMVIDVRDEAETPLYRLSLVFEAERLD